MEFGMTCLRNLMLATCLLLFAIAPASAQAKLALLFGNSQYTDFPQLLNPANDARLIAKQLETAGFTVNLQLDQTQSGMKSALADFVSKVENSGEGTVAVFYYAGHGVQIDGANYLLPVDVKGETASAVTLGAVAVNDILRTLEIAKAKVNVLILDACRNNPFPAKSRSTSRGLARLEAPAGSLVAYSTAPGQVALDGDGQNSPYAEALAKHISTPGLALESVFRNVRIDVSEKTAGSQVPWEETSLTQEVMFVNAQTTAKQETPVVAVTDNNVDAARAYQVAIGKNTIEAYDAFIQKFPNSTQISQAMRNLEMLNDENNWRRAAEQDTLGAYKIYLNLHPSGSYANVANARIANLSNAQQAEPEPTPKPQPSQLVTAQGFDLFGVDGETLRDVTFEQCSARCQNDDFCAAASYRPDLSRCYLKTAVSVLVRNPKSTVAVKPAAQPGMRTSNFEIRPQEDFPGNDIDSFKIDSAQQCLQTCEERRDCAAFAYVTTVKQCWLKSSAGPNVAAPPVVSGLRVQ
jgi:uncharacterized caspase-like protein